MLTDAAPGRVQERQLLREVLAGPLRFTPDNGRCRFERDAALGRVLAGIAGLATFVVRPGGPKPLPVNPRSRRSLAIRGLADR